MYIICAGMFRSASTWQYSVVCKLLEKKIMIERLGFPFLSEQQFLDYDTTHAAPKQIKIFKIHDGYPIFAEILNKNQAIAFYSYRDLRDVAFSLAHKLNLSFENLMLRDIFKSCQVNYRFWRNCPHVLQQSYEKIKNGNLASIREIADFLADRFHLTFTEEDLLSVENETTLAANTILIKTLTQNLIQQNIDLNKPENALLHDSHSLFHWNHIREGTHNQWQDLATPEQLLMLAEICGEWLISEKYETGYDWILPAIPTMLKTKLQIEQLESELKQILKQKDELQLQYEELRSNYARIRPHYDILLAKYGKLQSYKIVKLLKYSYLIFKKVKTTLGYRKHLNLTACSSSAKKILI